MNAGKKLLKIIQSSILCLRFPFLYPRNRFNGRHWNSWKIERYLNGYENSHWNNETKKIEKEYFEGVKDKAWYVNIDYSTPVAPTSRFMGKSTKIIKSYPYFIWYYLVLGVYNYILPIFHFIPTYTEWDSMPEGWNKAFGKQYLKDLRRQLIKDHQLFSFKIIQIKEKFGTLRLYYNQGSEELFNLVNSYEDKSYYTCINCGKPATRLTTGWICPYCDDCCPSNSYSPLNKSGEWDYDNIIIN